MPSSNARKIYKQKLDYNNAYNREHYRSFSIRLSVDNEKKIIKWLDKQPSTKAYLIELIEKDMEEKKAKKKNK